MTGRQDESWEAPEYQIPNAPTAGLAHKPADPPTKKSLSLIAGNRLDTGITSHRNTGAGRPGIDEGTSGKA